MKVKQIFPKSQKIIAPIKREKNNFMNTCREIRHKNIRELSAKDIPLLGATIGLFTPLPLGILLGYGIGKIIELIANCVRKK